MKIMVKIAATIRGEDGEVDTMEFTTEGRLHVQDEVVQVTYREAEFSGMPGSTTTLLIGRNRMVMRREGDATSDMVFEKGVRHASQYSTPYGIFKVEMLTREYYCGFDETHRGLVHANYDLSISGMTESNNKLTIEVF